MTRQIITVDIAPEVQSDRRLKVSQYDVGRPLGVYIVRNGEPVDCSGYTAQLYICKFDRALYERVCDINATENNLVMWETEEQETAAAGVSIAEIRIKQGDVNIGTANFTELVEESPSDMAVASHSESQSLIDMVDRAEDAAETAESSAAIAVHAKDETVAAAEAVERFDEMTAEAETLAPGSEATAEMDYSGEHPVMKFGIPVGLQGAQGPQGPQGVQGEKGETGVTGATGATPDFSVGTVTTLPAGSSATAEITGTAENPVLSLGIPQGVQGNQGETGPKGDKGDPGEVTQAEFETAMDEKAPVIISSASGTIASFPDGADDMPIKLLKVGIEPVQDLHGYDHPWPAGGGKNLINIDTVTVSAAGNWASNKELDKPIPAGTYTFAVTTSAQSAWTVWFRDENGNVVGQSASSTNIQGRQSVAVTLTGTATKIGGYLNAPATMSDFQLESGSIATAYAPYENVCPISGWTGVKVQRCGKNLLDPSLVKDQSSWNYKNIYVRPNATYVVSANFPNDNVLIFYAFNSAGWSSSSQVYNGNPVVVTTNEDGVIRLQQRRVDDTKSFMDYQIQVELGSVPTAYEPYQDQTYDIEFPSEAGTVYGGTLDVVTGKLVVDRFLYVYDGTESFQKSSTALNGYFNNLQSTSAWYIPHSWPGMRNYSYDVQISSEISSMFTVTRAANQYRNNYGYCYLDSGMNFNVPPETFGTTIESFKAKLAELYAAGTPVSVFAKIATPQTYHLTPTEIRTILGQNNIWADTGDVEAEYPADTKLYIQQLTKPTEDDMTANVAITSGKFFMIGNRLFLATAAIASGAMIIPGTNCTELSLADALNNINA